MLYLLSLGLVVHEAGDRGEVLLLLPLQLGDLGAEVPLQTHHGGPLLGVRPTQAWGRGRGLQSTDQGRGQG